MYFLIFLFEISKIFKNFLRNIRNFKVCFTSFTFSLYSDTMASVSYLKIFEVEIFAWRLSRFLPILSIVIVALFEKYSNVRKFEDSIFMWRFLEFLPILLMVIVVMWDPSDFTLFPIRKYSNIKKIRNFNIWFQTFRFCSDFNECDLDCTCSVSEDIWMFENLKFQNLILSIMLLLVWISFETIECSKIRSRNIYLTRFIRFYRLFQ